MNVPCLLPKSAKHLKFSITILEDRDFSSNKISLQSELFFRLLLKISLQTSLKRDFSNFLYIFLLNLNFKKLIIKLHVLYILNMHVKFYSNRILFTI